jgi:hypothetical protein
VCRTGEERHGSLGLMNAEVGGHPLPSLFCISAGMSGSKRVLNYSSFTEDTSSVHTPLQGKLLMPVDRGRLTGEGRQMDKITDLMDPQGQRVSRALIEGGDYRWGKRPDGTFACQTASGKVYIVSDAGCNCPDHLHRCAGTELRCKHQIALAHAKLAAGKLPEVQKPEPAPTPIVSEEAYRRIFG